MAVVLLAAACSSEPSTSDTSAPGGTPSATAPVEDVVDPTPSVVDGPEATVEPTPEPTPEPTLDRDQFASVTTLAAGEIAEDPSGVLLGVHGFAMSPPTIGPALALDLSMCGAGFGAETGESFEMQVAESRRAPLGEALRVLGPLVSPPFTFPDVGECRRGWVVVDDASEDPRIVRIIVGVADGDSTARHLYQWRVRAEDPTLDDTAFGAGETVTFNSGPLAETTVQVQGWAEFIGRPEPESGKRLVGVLVEVCPGGDVWPNLRLGIDGWVVVEPIDPNDRLGWDPATGGCVEDWAEFAVPFGAVPTGFAVQDFDASAAVSPRRLDEGHAFWTLEGAALAAPA